MPKRSEEQIVQDAQRILTALQKKGREDIRAIAQECQMSKERLLRTIRHLEKIHTIWGYTAVIEGQDHVEKFILLLKRTTEKFDNKALEEIMSHRFKEFYEPMGVTIESSYYVSGEYDWMIVFTASDLIQAKKFSSILFEHYPGIAAKVDLMQVLYTERDHFIPNPDLSKLREFL